MTDERNWGAEPWRAPKPAEGETVIYSEHGRVLDNTCYRSHWFMLIREAYGGYAVLVRHGAGEERVRIWSKRIVAALEHVDSDARYYLLHTIFTTWKQGREQGYSAAALEHKQAMAEGRLKCRKVRGRDEVKVWIEPTP